MVRFHVTAAAALFSTATASIVARQTAAPSVEAVSDCEVIQSTQYCSAGSTEFRIVATPTSGSLPSSYTGCHAHATDLWCEYSGGEVQVVAAGATVAPSTTSGTAAHDDHDDHDHAEETGAVTAVSECHMDNGAMYCMGGSTSFSMGTTPTNTQDLPAEYTGCHDHGPDLYCFGAGGVDVMASPVEEEENLQCHFHAGVEHCLAPGESENGGSTERTCERTDREYNVPLRVGLLFVIMATSAIGVFGPIFLIRWLPPKAHVIFLIIKQFGTGVVISTALVHLYTHAELMFQNPCLTGITFEGTTAAVVMGGLFLSFLVEFIGQRVVRHKMAQGYNARSWFSPETVSILVLEAGIIFHSILIGITLVVAGDSFFKTLFIVIIFHQMFEGLALGSRIAALGTKTAEQQVQQRIGGHGHGPAAVAAPAAPAADTKTGDLPPNYPTTTASTESSSVEENFKAPHFSLTKKCILASAFALITPLGMAIGIGVLDKFNGSNPNTLLAIAILDAISAGILIWVGVVEMWAEDWMYTHSELMNASPVVTILSLFGLMAGMALMGFLGKWA
ncbi:zinc/iron transporter protein [Plectosphaerella plurivora]|uniref:Zinc/iron transporter protein n=1 Tax=Plectosphaerella plurivora TaxID=936078 RepID=A0A9P8VA76_9PEZI|nr:zinc/iron transporter protein [Plectosphaerella plurivora]